jgi:hypothetical protein
MKMGRCDKVALPHFRLTASVQRSAAQRVGQGEENMMPDQPNKPAGAFETDGEPRPVEDQQAVKNQSTVTPEDYPEPAAGETGAAQK